jgi:hypothetical protein
MSSLCGILYSEAVEELRLGKTNVAELVRGAFKGALRAAEVRVACVSAGRA